MKRDNFYRRSPGDALAGMVGMTLEERGVYNTIIDLLYLTWRPLEDNRAYIAGHCGCAVQKLNPIIASLLAKRKLVQFEEAGITYLSNPRFEEERTEVKGASSTRSGRGKVAAKSAEVGEKSVGVRNNPPTCADEDAENQSVTALEKTRVEKTRENPPTPKGAVSDEDVEKVWRLGSQTSRDRSSRSELRDAIKARVKQGKPLEAILSGVGAYLRSPEQTRDDGKFQQGIHRVVKGARWESFVSTKPTPLFGAEPVDEIGTLERPGPRRQRAWMQDYATSPNSWREHERGPLPGQPGCRVSPEIQREFGIDPAKPQPIGRSAA